MPKMKDFRYLPILATLIWLASCANTQVTGAWKDADYRDKLTNVLVIGISDNTTTRRMFEDTVVRKFSEHDVKATSSATIAPQDKQLDKETIKKIIDENDFDAVLITRMVGLKTETQYVPATNYVTSPYYGSMYGFYNHAYGLAYDPGYMVDITIATLETNIYETAGEKLIWSMTTDSFAPDQIAKTISELESLIFSQLVKDGLI